MTRLKLLCAGAVIALFAETAIFADVLVLRDGRRVTGELVAVRGDTIEFEHADGREAGRVRRYDRQDVRSILFEDDRADGPRPGLRERLVMVDARRPWTDTGIDVRNGQDVAFTATGEVRWGPGRRDDAGGENDSPHNAARPMPGRNAAALIGKIGPNGDPFVIGDVREALRLRGSGRLFLGINDDYLQDNSGSFRVEISY